MKKYKVGDVLIRIDGGIRVISRMKNDRIFYMIGIYNDGNVRELPHFKHIVQGSMYKKIEV